MVFFSTLCSLLACTDPAKVLKVSASKQDVEVQESVSLQCTAEGNPRPNYTWMPCNERMCHGSNLVVSKVLYDDVYICNVTNSLGGDSGNVSVCKLLKNYLRLTYSTWDVYVILQYTIRLSVILTAMIVYQSCNFAFIYMYLFSDSFSVSFPFLKNFHAYYFYSSLLCIRFTTE